MDSIHVEHNQWGVSCGSRLARSGALSRENDSNGHEKARGVLRVGARPLAKCFATRRRCELLYVHLQALPRTPRLLIMSTVASGDAGGGDGGGSVAGSRSQPAGRAEPTSRCPLCKRNRREPNRCPKQRPKTSFVPFVHPDDPSSICLTCKAIVRSCRRGETASDVENSVNSSREAQQKWSKAAEDWE